MLLFLSSELDDDDIPKHTKLKELIMERYEIDLKSVLKELQVSTILCCYQFWNSLSLLRTQLVVYCTPLTYGVIRNSRPSWQSLLTSQLSTIAAIWFLEHGCWLFVQSKAVTQVLTLVRCFLTFCRSMVCITRSDSHCI